MKNTLLLQAWESLSAVEIRRLEKFLNSPYHNKHEGVLNLFKFLKKYGDKPEAELAREKVFVHVFPKEDYDDLKLRHVMSYMLKAMESFLILENDTTDSEGDFLLMDSYIKRDLESPFLAKWNTVQKRIENSKLKDESYHFNSFRLNDLGYRIDPSGPDGDASYLQNLSDDLDAWFLIKKMRTGSAMILQNRKDGLSLSNGLLDPVIITAKIMGLLTPPEIAVHFRAFQCLNEPDDFDHFFILKDLVKDPETRISAEEMREVLDIGIGFCDDKAAEGIPKYINEAFDLFVLGIENGAFLEDKKISPERISEIVTRAMQINAFTWALNLLDGFENSISGGFSRSHYLFQKSRLLFARGEYEEVRDLLSGVFIRHLPTRLMAEITLMRSLYEIAEFDELEKLVGSFTRGLHRKETPAESKKSYRNFARAIKKLVKSRGDDGKLQELRASIQYETDIAQQEWLIDKINEMF